VIRVPLRHHVCKRLEPVGNRKYLRGWNPLRKRRNNCGLDSLLDKFERHGLDFDHAARMGRVPWMRQAEKCLEINVEPLAGPLQVKLAYPRD
jgi:hypothetical protein